jgi:mannose-6-phosphate isomerase
LKLIVGQVLSASDEDIAKVYETLKKTPKEDFDEHFYIPELLPRLAKQYDKSDPRSLVTLLTMNFLVLQKGDAIYVPADGIHAYLSGDIVECMARSDNVINTGFCPQADRDSVALFTSALTFSPNSGKDAILKPEKSNKGAKDRTKVFAPPMSEFNMLLTELKGKDTETIQAIQGPGIMVITGGKGKLKADNSEFEVKEVYAFFLGTIRNSHLKLRMNWRLMLLTSKHGCDNRIMDNYDIEN